MSPSSHDNTAQHPQHASNSAALASMARSATLHCLTGCAIGEILGMLVGTARGMSMAATIALSVGLAFMFGYLLSTLPLLRAGLAIAPALTIVLAADTLSILTMEIVDNAVMALIPGAMGEGLANPLFWVSMMIAFGIAYLVAYPVNLALLRRGKGHALTHEYMGRPAVQGRGWIPDVAPTTLAVAIGSFMLGGLLVAWVDSMGWG